MFERDNRKVARIVLVDLRERRVVPVVPLVEFELCLGASQRRLQDFPAFRQELKGQLIRPIKGVKEVCISSAIDASVLDKPKFASAYLKGKLLLKGTQTQHNPHELENSLLVMMTSDYQNIIPTVHGDQAITVGTLHKEEQPPRRDADPSSQSNEDIVREGIEKANKNDLRQSEHGG